MSTDKAQDPTDRAEQLLASLAKISVDSIAKGVAAVLETKFAEQPHKQTLVRSKNQIILRQEVVLDSLVYVTILNEVLSQEVHRIFTHFYPTDPRFCLELVTKICVEVYDAPEEVVRAGIVNQLLVLQAAVQFT